VTEFSPESCQILSPQFQYYTGWPKKCPKHLCALYSEIVKIIIAKKHICNEQTSSNMCKNFRLKHFHISRDEKQNNVTHHKANYANGSSFTLPLICRLHQNVTVGQIINQLISRKCAE